MQTRKPYDWEENKPKTDVPAKPWDVPVAPAVTPMKDVVPAKKPKARKPVSAPTLPIHTPAPKAEKIEVWRAPDFWDKYDKMTLAEIEKLLTGKSESFKTEVLNYERAHQARSSVYELLSDRNSPAYVNA